MGRSAEISVREWKEDKVVDSGEKKHVIPLGVGRGLCFYKRYVWKGKNMSDFWGKEDSEGGTWKALYSCCMVQLVE